MNEQTPVTLGELYNPATSSNWQRVSLYSLADWINGLAFRSVNFTKNGKPIIKIAEIKNGVTKQTQFTDSQYDPNISIKNGDMLFAWSGQPETSIGVSVWRGRDGWLNQHIFKIQPHIQQVDKDFFYLLLKYLNKHFVRIARNKQTTGLGHVTKEDLRAMQIGLPEVAQQKILANIIMPLEQKIELLQKQNETLEQTAQAIFKEKFMKYTGDNLPTGWRFGELSEIAIVDWGNTNLTKSSYIPDGAYLGVSAAGCDGRMEAAEHEIGTVVISAIGEYAGVTFYPHEPFTAIKNTITVSPKKDISTGWYIHHLLMLNTIPRRGAAQPFLSKGDTQKYSVIIPPPSDIFCIDELFRPIEEKVRCNLKAIKTLAVIRDTLLPKLMSGELKI